jgi:murein DD-endopeptidase MepM/ murein hydrolase activator NlpD
MRWGWAFTKALLSVPAGVALGTLVLAVSTGVLAYSFTARVEAAPHAVAPQAAPAIVVAQPPAAPSPSPAEFGTGGPPATHEAAQPALPPVEPRPVFAWPADGAITSIFDAEHPLGIDLGVATGEPIHASAAGTVVFAGPEPCCGYGIKVDIDHGDGYVTRYGHLSAVKVRASDVVSQGQLIGLGGNTGYSTGPHLHFELRREGAVQDPMLFLGPR